MLVMPNIYYTLMKEYGYFFNFIESYFNITQFGFGKNANSFYVCVGIYPYCVVNVWRQSEFAFFVRLLRLAHFFHLRRFL